MHKPCQILAYGTLSTFLVFVLFYGFADSLTKMYPVGTRSSWPLDPPQIHKHHTFPDFSRYERLKKLSSKEFPSNDPTRRIIIVGDIHGMMHSLKELLKRVEYSASTDVLIHSGDIAAKGPHAGSLAVLNYMSSNNITGVRGNHDQKIIEWRGWLDWVSSIHGATSWLESLENRWHEAQVEDEDLALKYWVKRQRKSSSEKERAWWKLVPEDWIVFSDHYQIARDMPEKDFLYLLKLPLRLYIPSAHAFIVHAGLLPSDPKYPGDDKSRQPLAAMPTLPPRQRPTPQGVSSTIGGNFPEDANDNPDSSSRKTIENLRRIQEIGILTQIPQNTDPWVVLNMRSVVDGEISRKSEGTPWSEIWQEHMENCVGFNQELNRQSIENGGDLDGDDESDLNSDSDEKKLSLLCYPSTTIYGHAAGRGLDLKRWTFGLDSGCVYERRLSALVIQGRSAESFRRQSDSGMDNTFGENLEIENTSNDVPEDDVDEDDTSVATSRRRHHSLPFGDLNRATVVSVKCQL